MDIQTIIEETADTIRQIKSLAGVPVIEIDKGNVSKELEIKVAQAKVAITVGWNGFTPTIQGETAPGGLFGSTTIVVSLFEKPIVNRANATANRANATEPTLMNMAQAIARELHNAIAEGMSAPLYLKRITPISELAQGKDSSVVTCDVEFETKTSL